MACSDYRFSTRWRIQAPPEAIFEVLKDGQRYQDWWQPAYLRTEKVGEKRVKARVRAFLPYTLEFTTELTREDPPRELELRSIGELEGRGLWVLRPDGAYTEVHFHWEVRANKRLVRWLSFLLKPLFKWNHDWVMGQGEARLQEEVLRRGW